MVVTLGTYYAALQSDNFSGQSDSPKRTRMRAAQLRLTMLLKCNMLYAHDSSLYAMRGVAYTHHPVTTCEVTVL